MDNQTPSQNLVRQTLAGKPAVRTERPTSFYKAIFFDVLTVLSALWFSYAYRQFIDGGFSYFFPLLGAALFSVLALLGALLVEYLRRRFLVLGLSTLAFIVFFYEQPIEFILLGAVSAFVYLGWAEFLGRRELENALEIKFFRFARIYLQKLTTGLILMGVIVYLPRLNIVENILPRATFQNFFDWSSGIVERFYPSVDLSSSFDKLTESIAKIQLRGAPFFEDASVKEQENLINETAGRLIDNISKLVNATISGDQPVTDTTYELITNALEAWQKRFGVWFFVVWLIALFLLVRSVAILFHLAIGVLAWLAYQFLLAANVIYVTSELRSKKVVRFS